MKVKKNEVAIFNKICTINYGKGNVEKEILDKLYFFNGEDLKNLKRNSKNLYYWDGNNHQHIDIEFSHIETFSQITEEELNGDDWELSINETILSQSNMSGKCTPYYTEKWEA